MKQYQEIRGTEPLELKKLNDQLRLLWSKVTHINEKDINPGVINEIHFDSEVNDTLSLAKLTAVELETEKAKIADLEANKASIEQLDVERARIELLESKKASIDQLDVERARITYLETHKANVDDLTTINANIDTLFSEKANITDLDAITGSINDLYSSKADIDDLISINASIQNLWSNKADVADLTAQIGRIDNLYSNVGNINTLLSQRVFAELAEFGEIRAGSAIIADEAIGSSQISSLSVDKLEAGDISTAKFRVIGSDGRLQIQDNLLQVFDGTGTLFERIALGDINNDGSVYGLRIRGADGTTILFDENGQTKEGFTDGYNKLDNNSLDPVKINIDRVITRINEDGSETFKASKILLDNETLDVKFSTVVTDLANQGQEISNHSAQITALNGAIALKLDSQDFDTYTSVLDGEIQTITTNLSKATTDIAALQGEIVLKVEQTDIETAIGNVQVGGRNLLYNTSDEWTELELSESDYFAQFVHPEVILEVGKTYVFSVIIEKVSDDDAPINIHLGTGTTSYEKDIHEWRLDNIPFGEKISLVYTIQEEDLGEHTGIFAWRISNEQQVTTVRFKEVKLEEGNKPTGWTPALEDMVELIDNTATRIEERVAKLDISLDDITSEVSTVVTEIDGLREHTETLVQQTSSELSVQITDSLSSLEEDLIQRLQANIQATAEDLLLTFTGFQGSLEGLSEDIANFQTTFRLSGEGLEIGRAEDPFKLFLTNNKMSILDSGSEVAYVSDRKMFITEAEITNSFKVGNHLIERHNDEITLVRWVG